MNTSELKSLIELGEGYKLEFKEKLNKEFSKEVVAFANTEGGKILIGVDDNGHIVGVKDRNKVLSSIENSIKECEPPIEFNTIIIDDIIIVSVEKGINKPYKCPFGYFKRFGSNCLKLNHLEMSDLIIEGNFHFDSIVRNDVDFIEELDKDYWEQFLSKSGIKASQTINNTIVNLGGAILKDDKYYFNNTGLLFFSKNPSAFIPNSVIDCVLYKGNSKTHIIDRKTLSGKILDNIQDGINFFYKHLKLRYVISDRLSNRKEVLEIPPVVIREAIVNAVTHRDYLDRSGKCMFEIFDNRIVISNFGGLVKGINQSNFGKLSKTRNTKIADILFRTEYCEKVGSGINRIYDNLMENGLKKPLFELDDHFTITIPRMTDSDETEINQAISEANSDLNYYLFEELTKLGYKSNNKDKNLRITRILTSINNQNFNSARIAYESNIDERTIRRDLKQLEDLKIINSLGTTRNKEYFIISETIKELC